MRELPALVQPLGPPYLPGRTLAPVNGLANPHLTEPTSDSGQETYAGTICRLFARTRICAQSGKGASSLCFALLLPLFDLEDPAAQAFRRTQTPSPLYRRERKS